MQSPKKSTSKLSQQAHISRTTCRRVLKSLDFKPYCVTVVQQLQEADIVKRVNYCTWLLNSICAGLLDPLQYIMSDEALFHLSGQVNSQNTLYWAAENPHLVHEQPLQDQKISVWCALSGTRIIGLIFFDRTVNTEVYTNIFEEFCTQQKKKDGFSSSRTGRHATILGCPCSKFMTSSLRNEQLAKICGCHILLTLQHTTIFSGDTLKVQYMNQIRTR